MATYNIISHSGTGKYLNLAGSGAAYAHRNVNIYDSTSSNDQKWTIASLSGTQQILSVTGSTYGLNAKRSVTPWNCDILAVAGNTTDSQVKFEKISAGIYRIYLANYSGYYLTAEGTASGSNVSWQALNTSSSAQKWKLQDVSSGGASSSATSNSLTIPSGRRCNWNQFYSGITNIVGTSGCSITCGLDVANFYGPKAYTMSDMKSYWTAGGYTWEIPGNGSIIKKTAYKNSTDAERFAVIRTEIDSGHPVIVYITGNGTHYVVAYGYTNGGSIAECIKVFDPARSKTDTATIDGRDTTLSNAITWSGHTGVGGLILTTI